MKDLLKMHQIQEYYFTVESENIPERCNRSFSLFTTCLIDLVYSLYHSQKAYANIGGWRRRATKFLRRQFTPCNRRVKNYS